MNNELKVFENDEVLPTICKHGATIAKTKNDSATNIIRKYCIECNNVKEQMIDTSEGSVTCLTCGRKVFPSALARKLKSIKQGD